MKHKIMIVAFTLGGLCFGNPVKDVLSLRSAFNSDAASNIVEVEYLESTGTQWINTEMIPDIFTEAHIEAQCTAKANGGIQIVAGAGWGNVYGSNFNILGIDSRKRINTKIAGTSRYYDSSLTIPEGEVFLISVDILSDNGKFLLYCNGYSETAIVTASHLSRWRYPLCLFANASPIDSDSWQPEYLCYPGTRIYSFRMSNGTSAIDLVPVRIGNLGYMYDRISGELFGNMGLGEFIVGPDK